MTRTTELLLPPHVHCASCGRENRPQAVCSWCRAPIEPAASGRATASHLFEEATARPEPIEVTAAAAVAPPVRTPPARPNPTAPRPVKPVPRRGFRPADLWKRHLPPVRLVWISLLALTAYGGGFVSAARALPLAALILPAVAADVGFQRVRFPRLRFPDSALATALFLVLIIWPSDVSIALTSLAVASIGIRHVVRSGGHPWLNPAAAGITLGVLLFGVPTNWHIGVNLTESVLVVGLGLLVLARAPRTWRLPAFFFAAYVPVIVALSMLTGGHGIAAQLFTTGALSAAPLFFGLFMVTEPRTAPSSGRAMPAFALLVGVAAAGLPVLFNELPLVAALGIVAPFLALFAGNALTILLPAARGRQATTASRTASPAPAAAVRPTMPKLPRSRPVRPGGSPVGRSTPSIEH